MEVIKRGINPFTTTTEGLFNIMTGEIASKDVEANLLCAKEMGMHVYCSYPPGGQPTLKVIKLKFFTIFHIKKKKNPLVKIKDNLYNKTVMLKKILFIKKKKNISEHFQSLL